MQYLLGEVSIASNGTNQWVAAALNLSLTINTDIWADKNSRAELNVGDGFIRLNSETSVTLTNVSRSTVQFRVNQGSVSLTVQRLMSGEIYEIDTPNGTLRSDRRSGCRNFWSTTESRQAGRERNLLLLRYEGNVR